MKRFTVNNEGKQLDEFYMLSDADPITVLANWLDNHDIPFELIERAEDGVFCAVDEFGAYTYYLEGDYRQFGYGRTN